MKCSTLSFCELVFQRWNSCQKYKHFPVQIAACESAKLDSFFAVEKIISSVWQRSVAIAPWLIRIVFDTKASFAKVNKNKLVLKVYWIIRQERRWHESQPVCPDLENFHHFCKNIKALGKF